jgi:hypothetical protein
LITPRRVGRSALFLAIAIAASGTAKAQGIRGLGGVYGPAGYADYYGETGYYNYPYRAPGYYRFVPPEISSPKTLIPNRGITGRVLALDERQRSITLRLPAETVEVPYGPTTQFRAAEGVSPEITPGTIINVSSNLITVLGPGR